MLRIWDVYPGSRIYSNDREGGGGEFNVLPFFWSHQFHKNFNYQFKLFVFTLNFMKLTAILIECGSNDASDVESHLNTLWNVPDPGYQNAADPDPQHCFIERKKT